MHETGTPQVSKLLSERQTQMSLYAPIREQVIEEVRVGVCTLR